MRDGSSVLNGGEYDDDWLLDALMMEAVNSSET